MPSHKRLESLRRKLVKVTGSEHLESLTERLEPVASALESAVGASGSSRLDVARPETKTAVRKLKDGDFDAIDGHESVLLEAIVEREGRPVSFIVNDRFEDLPAPWTHFNAGSIRALLDAAIPSIGRVERLSPAGIRTDHIGTGFIVGPRLMMTNRHVAEVFVLGAGSEPLRFMPGGRMDFGRERGFNPLDLTHTLRITGVKMVHPYWDMALLEIEDLPDAIAPLRLSTLPPDEILRRPEGSEIAVIGYPGRGNDLSDVAQDLQEKHFGNVFGVKRIAPGDVDGHEVTVSFKHDVDAMIHDCSTLAGNSGSAVVDVVSGYVVGLHFKGVTLQANYSVPMHELARDRRVVDMGLSFQGSVPPTDEWESWWNQPTNGETLVTPRPVAVQGVSLPKPDVAAGTGNTGVWTVPITISISLDGALPSASAALAPAPVGTPAEAEESFQIPVIHGELKKRAGYQPGFLGLPGGKKVPLPVLTAKGKQAAAKLADGSHELKYHHFSVVMHKARRLALFTASNVDWRTASREIDGRKPTRAALTGIPAGVLEQWVMDERIGADEQLPDVFFQRDRQAFDKGHLVRRDDVVWGDSFDDMQKANGDTFFTTNCSPQVKGFNRAAAGDHNWGDLENMIQRQTKAEKVIVFAGPVLSRQDRFFLGVTETGPLKLQIPRFFWKIIVAPTDDGVRAFGFLPEQDLSAVPLEEAMAMPIDWRKHQVNIRHIEDKLSGLLDLSWCRERDGLAR